jgi:hypothetical protein
MPVPEFAIDINLDGRSYPSARGGLGQREIAVQYVPKVKSERINQAGDATLDPVEYTSFHRGAGASRNVGYENMVAYGENIWTCDPGLLMPGPEVTSVALSGANAPPRPDGIAEANGHIFAACGRYVFRITAGQDIAPVPSQDLDLGAANSGGCLRRFGSSLFLTSTVTATGAGLNLYERPDGGAWTNALAGSVAVQPTGALGRVYWNAGGVTSERLVAQFSNRGLRYCASAPRNDTSWTPGLANPAIDIGGEGSVIQRFVTTLSHLYIASTAGLHDLDASGLAPNLVPQSEQMPSATSGLAAMAADGYLYYSSGFQLFRVQVTGQDYARVETVTPGVRLPNETPFGGYGTAMVKRGDWIIFCSYDATNDVSWIMWGRDAEQNEVGPVVWNVAPIVLRGFKVTALHASSLDSGGPRLWMFGTTQAGAVSLRWAPLALTTPYADLKSGRAKRFSQTAYAVLPAEDGGDDSVPKDIEEVLNENEGMAVGNTIKVSARRETETAFTQLAAFTTGPRVLRAVPVAFVSQRPTFRIDFVGAAVSPPISRRLSIRWLPNPDVREVRRYILKLGRAEQYASGKWSNIGADEELDHLTRLATTAARVTLVDETNTRLMVRVLKLEGPTEYVATETNDRALMAAVTLSIFGTMPLATFVWDSGVRYDNQHSWA